MSQVIIYKNESDHIGIDVLFKDDSVWLSLSQMSELFGKEKQTIMHHIKNIFTEGELDEKSVVQSYQTEVNDRVSRNISYYNFDMIISVAYRIKSPQAAKFRIWATRKLHEYITKGFILKEEIMKEFFVQKMFIKDVREIKNFEIPLDESERKHLIITGKNGSGKTSTLVEIDTLLNKLINNQFAQMAQLKKNIENYIVAIGQSKKNIENFQKNIEIQKQQEKVLMQNAEVNHQQITQVENNIKSYASNIINDKTNIQNYEKQIIQLQKQIDEFSKVELIFSNQSDIYENIVNGKFILAFFKAKRQNEPTIPQTPTKQIFQQKYLTTADLNKTFVQYMLNLKTAQAFAQIRSELEKVDKIHQWFENFETKLKELFDQDDLKVVFYEQEYNFKIEYDSKKFGLNELSDGYSSLLAILTELILRMEAQQAEAYDMQGVVLIDEIETHLHVELQKKVLPFLTGFFPKIQFIVTTHSPFVLSSLSNAVICDLEKRVVTSDLSAYSYDALVESYFDSDKYSSEIKEKVKMYESLSQKSDLSGVEKDEYINLKRFFKTLPTYKADELAVKIKEILRNDAHRG